MNVQKRAQKLAEYYKKFAAVRKIARMSNWSRDKKYTRSLFAEELQKLSRSYPDLQLDVAVDCDEFSWFGVAVSRNQNRDWDNTSNFAIFNKIGLKLGLNGLISNLWQENDLQVKDKLWYSIQEFNVDWKQKESRKKIFLCSHDWLESCLNCKQKRSYVRGLLNKGFDYYHESNKDDLYLIYLAGFDYYLEEINSSLLKLE
jgi:hypothetical protein